MGSLPPINRISTVTHCHNIHNIPTHNGATTSLTCLDHFQCCFEAPRHCGSHYCADPNLRTFTSPVAGWFNQQKWWFHWSLRVFKNHILDNMMVNYFYIYIYDMLWDMDMGLYRDSWCCWCPSSLANLENIAPLSQVGWNRYRIKSNHGQWMLMVAIN